MSSVSSVDDGQVGVSMEKVMIEQNFLTDLGPGQCFGELALLYNSPRAATVEAVEHSTVFVIGRQDFKKILRAQAQKKLDFYAKLVNKVELLAPLLREEKHALVECFTEIHYHKGATIINEGDVGNTFYFLYSGRVSISKGGEVISELTANAAEGLCPYFGEKALLENCPRQSTVQVASDTAAVLVLDRDTFEQVLGPLKDIVQDASEGKTRDDNRRSRVGGGAKRRSPSTLTNGTANMMKVPKRSELTKIGLLGKLAVILNT